MLKTTPIRPFIKKGVHTVTFFDQYNIAKEKSSSSNISARVRTTPCAQRWTLRLAKARLFNEYIDENDTGAWQLQDDRLMSPEFDSFIGYNSLRGGNGGGISNDRMVRPGVDDITRPQAMFRQRLPNNSWLELSARKDVPLAADNMYMGRKLHDENIHGVYLPGLYRIKKDLNKATRNDKKVVKKGKGLNYQGIKTPPSGWQPIPDDNDEDKDD